MKYPLSLIAPLMLFNFAAHAENNHSGFYIGVDASYETMSVKTPTATENFGTGSSVILHAGYELPLNDKYSVLLGGTYDIDYYLKGSTGSDVTVFTKGTEKIDQKNQMGLLCCSRHVFVGQQIYICQTDLDQHENRPRWCEVAIPQFLIRWLWGWIQIHIHARQLDHS